MNNIGNNLSALLANPHLRYPVLAYGALEILTVWLPQYASQIAASQKIIAIYLIAAASNSGPVADKPKG